MTQRTAFVDSLAAAMPSVQARMALFAALAQWAGATVYIPANSRARRREGAAERMLSNGMPQGEVVDALRARYNVSQRTAWRDVAAARKMASKSGTDAQ